MEQDEKLVSGKFLIDMDMRLSFYNRQRCLNEMVIITLDSVF